MSQWTWIHEHCDKKYTRYICWQVAIRIHLSSSWDNQRMERSDGFCENIFWKISLEEKEFDPEDSKEEHPDDFCYRRISIIDWKWASLSHGFYKIHLSHRLRRWCDELHRDGVLYRTPLHRPQPCSSFRSQIKHFFFLALLRLHSSPPHYHCYHHGLLFLPLAPVTLWTYSIDTFHRVLCSNSFIISVTDNEMAIF